MDEFWYHTLLANAKNKKVIIMCKKLKELDGLSAEQILEIYGDKTIPISIEKVLNDLGVKYDSMDFTATEKNIPEIVNKRGHILGAVTIINDDVNIFYSADCENKHRIDFTLAHELAHCCLNASSLKNKGHIEFRFDEKSKNPAEVAANTFAGKLLIPKDILLPMYYEMIAPLSDVLAREFDVSLNVMEERLKSLGLAFYSPNTVNNTI